MNETDIITLIGAVGVFGLLICVIFLLNKWHESRHPEIYKKNKK